MDQEPCVSLVKSSERLLGKTPEPNRKNAFNDTIRLREAGMNAVTFGPGEDGWAADNEWISITKSVSLSQDLCSYDHGYSEGPQPMREAFREKRRSNLLSAGSVTFMLLLWVFVTSTGLANELFLRGPAAIWDAFIKAATKGYQGSTLLEHVGMSLWRRTSRKRSLWGI